MSHALASLQQAARVGNGRKDGRNGDTLNESYSSKLLTETNSSRAPIPAYWAGITASYSESCFQLSRLIGSG